MTHTDQVYGPFMGGDPRLFKPDEECCTPAEIAAWQAACRDWEAGNGVNRGPSCATMGDASAWTGAGFGVGVTTIPDCDCDEPPGGVCIHERPMTEDCAECDAITDLVLRPLP